MAFSWIQDMPLLCSHIRFYCWTQQHSTHVVIHQCWQNNLSLNMLKIPKQHKAMLEIGDGGWVLFVNLLLSIMKFWKIFCQLCRKRESFLSFLPWLFFSEATFLEWLLVSLKITSTTDHKIEVQKKSRKQNQLQKFKNQLKLREIPLLWCLPE